MINDNLSLATIRLTTLSTYIFSMTKTLELSCRYLKKNTAFILEFLTNWVQSNFLDVSMGNNIFLPLKT